MHTYFYIPLQQHICIIYKEIFKSNDVVTLNPSLTDCRLKVHLKIQIHQTSFQAFINFILERLKKR